MRRPASLVMITVVLALAPQARASDGAMLAAAGAADAVGRATALASASSPASVERAYGSARNMREALRAALPVSVGCAAYAGWAIRFAEASTEIANGYDRLEPPRVRAARTSAARARSRMTATRPDCRAGATAPVPPVPSLRAPRSGAAFFGDVVAARPSRADAAELLMDGALVGPLALRSDGTVRARLVAAPGRHDLEVRFRRAGVVIGRAASRRVWLLPANALGVVRSPTASSALQERLRQAAGRFDGVAGIWVHDLATGAAGSWNAGARFPAASTVKLGVMVEAMRRTGRRPERSRLAVDVAAIGGWSSNLAPNRLMPVIGGPAGAVAGLRRLGAGASTYPGNYIVATARPPVGVVVQPALSTRRVTTAADMGRAILRLHRAARGEAKALQATGMTVGQARLLLGDLLASQRTGDNLGIVAQAFAPGVPIAQKHGWISSVRNTVALAYTERGPVVVVVLTSSPGLTRTRAAALGTEVVRAVRPDVVG